MPYIGTSPSSAATATSLTDADDNTKIQVEESSDENIIRFDVAGSEAMRINADGSVKMVCLLYTSPSPRD